MFQYHVGGGGIVSVCTTLYLSTDLYDISVVVIFQCVPLSFYPFSLTSRYQSRSLLPTPAWSEAGAHPHDDPCCVPSTILCRLERYRQVRWCNATFPRRQIAVLNCALLMRTDPNLGMRNHVGGKHCRTERHSATTRA